ncbi:MAG: twin-arginine translocase TatA/TatE family subunit [Deferribacterales bacterium]
MFGLGSQEIIIILLIAVVLFGAGKLPQIGEGMGKAIKNFKKAAKDADEAVDITPEEDKKKISESNDKEA